jgi:hypothetical protein
MIVGVARCNVNVSGLLSLMMTGWLTMLCLLGVGWLLLSVKSYGGGQVVTT